MLVYDVNDEISGNSGSDTLALVSGTNLDLTASSVSSRLDSIEVIQLNSSFAGGIGQALTNSSQICLDAANVKTLSYKNSITI